MSVTTWLQGQFSVTTQIILVAIGTFIIVHLLTKKKYKLPNGPTPLPLIGNIMSFAFANFGECINKWHEKYGPVVTFYVGTKRMVIINEIDHLNEGFVKRGADFSDRTRIHSLEVFTEGNKDIMMANYGDMFKYQRKIMSVALRQYLTGVQLEQRVHQVLQPLITAMLGQQEAFNPAAFIDLSVVNVVHGICFDTVLDVEDPEFIRIQKMLNDMSDLSGAGFLEDFFPPMRLCPTGKYKSFISLSDQWNGHIRGQYMSHKESLDKENPRDLTDTIILAKLQADEEGSTTVEEYTETHAVQIIADVFGGGVDTSRTQLTWLFMVISAMPEVQRKLQEEVDRVVGSAVPGKEHRHKLVYVEAVMLEAMRLYPVAPLGVPHETMQDTAVGGYEIPAKTTIVANQMAIMHDPAHWDEPLKFKPERFLDDSGTKLVSRGASWIPFSLGHRACPGESMAKLQIVYVIAGLLQRLTFTLDTSTEPDFSCNQDGFTNRPRDYKVLVTSR